MIFDIGFCIHQHCSPTFLLLDPFCGPKEPWQTFTLAHTYSNLTSTGSVQTLFLETGGWGSCVQWNRDSAPMWKKDLYTVVSERKRGERVRWSPETGDGWRSPTAVKPRNLLPPSQNFPSFICYFHFFFSHHPQKKVQRPIWLTIESMQVWHCAAVRRSFHGEIPQRNSSGGEIGSSAQRVCTKLGGGRKSTKSQRINNNEVLSDSEGKKTDLRANCCHTQSMSKSRPWGACDGGLWMETMRPNIEMAVACCLDSRHGGAFDNDTGCGKGGLSWEARDGQAHVYGLTKVQRLDNRPQTCSSIQN